MRPAWALTRHMSSKDDDAIIIFAEEATAERYQVLSFDLPRHGDRKDEDYACKVQNCVSDLAAIMDYARTVSSKISLFACSMGAYFSLLTYRDFPFEQCLFLSPVVSMERIINIIMSWFNISEDRLKSKERLKRQSGRHSTGIITAM